MTLGMTTQQNYVCLKIHLSLTPKLLGSLGKMTVMKQEHLPPCPHSVCVFVLTHVPNRVVFWFESENEGSLRLPCPQAKAWCFFLGRLLEAKEWNEEGTVRPEVALLYNHWAALPEPLAFHPSLLRGLTSQRGNSVGILEPGKVLHWFLHSLLQQCSLEGRANFAKYLWIQLSLGRENTMNQAQTFSLS